MIIKLSCYCINCDTEIIKNTAHFTDNEPKVNISEFEQTDWVCSECGHTTAIGDINMIDSEDLK